MCKFTYLLLLTAGLILDCFYTTGQNRWSKSYFENLDTPVYFVIEDYDKGYLMFGKYGANYSKYNWLIKTDINGEVLWGKTLGNGINSIALLDMSQDSGGTKYLGGGTKVYDPNGDPIIIKLDSCGVKEWCRIFYSENNMDYSSCITLTPEGEPVIVLNLTNPDHNIERICLAKISSEGELLWKQCYTSADTSQIGEISYDVISIPDNGFLITGYSYYEDPEEPDLYWLHPYYLKVDSVGNFEWETVVFKETNLHGGIANNTVISPNGQYYYSSISHYYHDTNLASPALVKLDLEGNVIGVYDVVSGFKEGKLSYAQFINDSTLAASAGWGNSENDLWSRAVIIDTLGNLLNSTVLMQDLYTSILDVAYDGKLVYASNTYQNNQFDFYLSKLNQNLEDDTLYTRPFTYDSLCPYQIVSDTIVQDDCELIVGIEEQGGGEAWEQGGMEAGKRGSLVVWPNPTSGVLSVECLGLSEFCDCELMIYDVFGRSVVANIISSPMEGGGREGGGEMSWTLDVSSLPPGIYFVSASDHGNRVAGAKFVVVH